MALYTRPRNTRVLVISLVMASLLTITIDYRGGEDGPLEAAGEAALSVVGTVQGGVSAVVRPVADFFTGLAHIGSLRAENERLRERIQELENQVGQTTSQARELEALQDLLKISQELGIKRELPARVIGESVDNFEWTITLNQGADGGVQAGMPVISGDGLVGHVIEVTPNISVVQLIIDPDSAVAGRLAASGETGVVLGRQTNPLTMDLISPDVKVVTNEQVVTSGFELADGAGSIYPPGIPIGFVSHIYSRPGSLTKTIEVRPAVNFSALETVLIVIRS